MTNLNSDVVSEQLGKKHVSDSDQWQRIHLIIKMRWLLLLMITIYALFSAVFIYYTAPNQHLSTIQIKSLIGTFCAIILFNFLSQQTNARTHHAPYLRGTQICADLVFATILIHLTGGGSSWLWPLYLIIALESSFLFTLRRYMAINVGLSSLLFGSVLWAGYHDFLTAIDLNVFYSQHKHNGSYLILLWLWVSILNITATIIGYYLNKTIRQESQEVFNKENRLLRFMESAQDLIIAFDESNKIHFMNNAVRVRLGIEDSEDELFIEQVIHSDDLALWSRKTCLLGVGETFKPAIFHLTYQFRRNSTRRLSYQ